MEITYTIRMDGTDLHWRMIGTDTAQIEGNIMPTIFTASVYGLLKDATDNTEEYLKTRLGDRVVEYEQLIVDNINKQKL